MMVEGVNVVVKKFGLILILTLVLTSSTSAEILKLIGGMSKYLRFNFNFDKISVTFVPEKRDATNCFAVRAVGSINGDYEQHVICVSLEQFGLSDLNQLLYLGYDDASKKLKLFSLPSLPNFLWLARRDDSSRSKLESVLWTGVRVGYVLVSLTSNKGPGKPLSLAIEPPISIPWIS